MRDLLFPPWCRVSAAANTYVGNAAVSRSIFDGTPLSTARSGTRLRFAFNIQNAYNHATEPERAYLSALSAAMRGAENYVWMVPPGYTGPRGSFPAAEHLTNNTFASGTTGLSAVASSASLSVADRVLRVSHTRAQSYAMATLSSPVSVSQYAPYSLRAMLQIGRNTGSNIYELFAGDTATNASLVNASYAISNSAELRSTSFVDRFGSIYAGFDYNGSGAVAGDFFDVPWWSLSPCFLIDNGPNLLTYSDQFDNVAWTKTGSTTVGADAVAAPDGTTTGDNIIEWAATNNPQVQRTISVSSSAADYSITVCAKRSTRNYVGVVLIEDGSGTLVYRVFNLNTGAVGTATASGANWSNERSVIRSLGNDWYACTLTARKTNAATGITLQLFANNADSGGSYTMSAGAVAIQLWRATLAQSSVPTRLVQTTSIALPTGTAQTGNALYVKGGPTSGAGSGQGSLLIDDWTQIGNQPQKLIASLDFDAAGLGYLQMHRPLRSSPADNAPVIVNNPMGRFKTVNQELTHRLSPGRFADFDFDLEEA